MICQWKRILLTRAAEWDMPVGVEWSFLLHNNYHPNSASFNVLWFCQEERFPRAVAKVCPQENVLRREFENLTCVYPLARGCVPKPLHLELVDGLWMLWMAGVPGLRVSSRRNYSPSELTPVVDMLASIHRAVQSGAEACSPDRHARMVAEPLDAVIRFGASAAVRAGCTALAEVSSALWINALPVIPQHGDLFLDNVLRHRNQWHVVDWETFGAIDLPFYDLLTLLVSVLRASGEIQGRSSPKLSGQVPVLIGRYARALQLPVSLVKVLLPLTLANWFYLHWLEGRMATMERMYGALEHYFEHNDIWEGIFFRDYGLEQT